MSTLLHHIKPWIQRSIAEEEERLERKIAQYTKRKVMEVHLLFDAFKLRILARPNPTVDPTALKDTVES